MGCEVSFPGHAASAQEARHWLTGELRSAALGPEPLFRAEQVFAELMNNAIRHSRSGLPGGGVHARLRIGASLLRLEVTDDGSDVSEPRARRSGPGVESGHGLFLVETLSARWWTRTDGAHRTMYAEIPYATADVPIPSGTGTDAVPQAVGQEVGP
ncbi:ATP-binding protein [Spiractinospora alimapuensis]|uniref:ATP-binding protein n=1 Tax=Spiractinospora alimapuensis TaxID=2820884 RepID=UPI001F3C0E0F|nr:ATP-binding protein [Spiractinospora alimapuensis]QVQ50151.1 ATP-binding protein [Spiractinospora alimapuensis]